MAWSPPSPSKKPVLLGLSELTAQGSLNDSSSSYYGLNCVPPNPHVEVRTPVRQNGALFGDDLQGGEHVKVKSVGWP